MDWYQFLMFAFGLYMMHRDTQKSIDSIKDEMKDFHARLCVLEEKYVQIMSRLMEKKWCSCAKFSWFLFQVLCFRSHCIYGWDANVKIFGKNLKKTNKMKAWIHHIEWAILMCAFIFGTFYLYKKLDNIEQKKEKL